MNPPPLPSFSKTWWPKTWWPKTWWHTSMLGGQKLGGQKFGGTHRYPKSPNPISKNIFYV